MTHHNDKSQSGNVLFMIFIAVALMGALTAVMMRGGGEQATSMTATRISEQLKSQAASIRSAIVECDLTNNLGYPVENAVTLDAVNCQIDATPTYQPLFTGTANRFVPVPPEPFNAWYYNNDGAGTISISIDTPGANAADLGIIQALESLKTQYGTEVTIVNNGSAASFELFITKP